MRKDSLARRMMLSAALVLALAAAAPTRSTPVPLVAQPGPTPLDAAARALVAADLAQARQAGETPLVLVGSAVLGGGAQERPALFVQLQSARECGSAGCTTAVYMWRSNAWKRVLDGASGGIAVAATRTRGMADLVTDKERYVWDGHRVPGLKAGAAGGPHAPGKAAVDLSVVRFALRCSDSVPRGTSNGSRIPSTPAQAQRRGSSDQVRR